MTRNGFKADPKKVEAIIKFLQDLSELCEPLRRLTHKKAEWNWTHRLKVLSQKCQCSSTLVRVTQPKAKEIHLKMDLALH